MGWDEVGGGPVHLEVQSEGFLTPVNARSWFKWHLKVSYRNLSLTSATTRQGLAGLQEPAVAGGLQHLEQGKEPPNQG